MEWFLLWIAFAVLSAIVGSSKGLGGFAWFVIGFLFGPFGFVASLVVKKNERALEASGVSNGTLKKCPACAEVIKAEAFKKWDKESIYPIDLTQRDFFLHKETKRKIGLAKEQH